MALNLQQLLDDLPQTGRVEWIGLRPAQKQPMLEVDTVQGCPEKALHGDRYSGRSRKRQITLIQSEHLSVIASFLSIPSVRPEQLRRNILVSGINLLALKDKEFEIGSIRARFTGLCHPCSAMQAEFGPGGYNAVRGHGGITAEILMAGSISVQDTIKAIT